LAFFISCGKLKFDSPLKCQHGSRFPSASSLGRQFSFENARYHPDIDMSDKLGRGKAPHTWSMHMPASADSGSQSHCNVLKCSSH
jgi:hypothetical protein